MNRNYVIINGVNSLTIKGLAINLMPPITKPLMRTMREEIDGRNGDINTELGYQAYDKQIEVGLYGNYDIDEIIAFFNSKGTIVFSDENDKFYNFQILDKIDFAKMVKFRTAMINIHCQPFKYPLTDTPVDVAYDYVESTGTNLTIDNTAEAIFNKIELQGNTSQITYNGYNLLGLVDGTYTHNGITAVVSNGEITLNGTANGNAFPLITSINPVWVEGSNYTYQMNNPVANTNIQFRTNGTGVLDVRLNNSNEIVTKQASNDMLTDYIAIRVQSGATLTNFKLKPMIELGSTAHNYEPYVGGVPSPNPNYPQPVEVVTGDNVVKVCGKNLINNALFHNDEGTTISGYTNEYVIATFVGQYRGSHQYYKLKDGIAYTFSVGNISINGVANDTARIELRFIKDGSIVTTLNKNVTRNSSYTFTANTTLYDYIRVGISNGALSGTNTIKFENLQLKVGNTSTNYEPYVGSSYPIYLPVKNYGSSNSKLTNEQIYFYFDKPSSKTLTIQFKINENLNGNNLAYIGNNISNSNVAQLTGNAGTRVVSTFTLTDEQYNDLNATGNRLRLYKSGANFDLPTDYCLETGTKANSYTPYGTTPIELCKIGDYQDYIYKENNKWLLHKEIGKIIFDGTEANWSSNTSGSNKIFYREIIGKSGATGTNVRVYTNYFNYNSGLNWQQLANGEITMQSNSDYIFIRYDEAQIIGNFKTWLKTHNLVVYYILAIPTTTQITEEQLVEQLNAIQNALSYSGQTNITQENSDKPFMIDATALKKGSDTAVLNNIGNIYSKPVIALKGTGIVSIYNDGVQAFQVDMSEENDIIIDTEMMEAYTPTKLANRQVTGDYSKFMIDTGSHDVKFDGELTEATITRYVRWL